MQDLLPGLVLLAVFIAYVVTTVIQDPTLGDLDFDSMDD